jgi:hypothetical protein
MIINQEKEEKIKKEETQWLNDVKKSREIVTEILRFGVSQEQIKNIIGLLALELEDVQLMKSIRELTEQEENQKTKILLGGE